jgi:hypothetical protein
MLNNLEYKYTTYNVILQIYFVKKRLTTPPHQSPPERICLATPSYFSSRTNCQTTFRVPDVPLVPDVPKNKKPLVETRGYQS